MNKKAMVLFRVAVITAAGLLASAAYGSDGRNDTNYFTNDDLEQYKGQDENTIGKQPGSTKQDVSGKKKDEREREYWCKKASPYRRKIERLKDDLREAEQRQSDSFKDPRKKSKPVRSKVKSSRRRLIDAERDLEELEDEAYRKGIPQGWLRCQFE